MQFEAPLLVPEKHPELVGPAAPTGSGNTGDGGSKGQDKALAIDEAPAGADVPIDSYDVDRSKLALHGADGRRCGCELCKVVKQRRHSAKSGSHPHAEAKI